MGKINNGYSLSVSVSIITIFGCCCWWVCCSYANPVCNNNNYTEGTQLAESIATLLDNLLKASSQAAAFNMSVVGEGKNTVYGIFQCRGDKTAAECSHCSRNALRNIQQECIHSAGSAIWYNCTCFMRFEMYNFSRRRDLTPLSAPDVANSGVSDPESFDKSKKQLLTNLSVEATSTKGSIRYASGSTAAGILKIYGMVQCWQDICMDDCRVCLDHALQYLFNFTRGKQGGYSTLESCNVEFQTWPFFAAPAIHPPPPHHNSNPPPPHNAASPSYRLPGGSTSHHHHLVVILASSLDPVFLLLILACFLWVARRKRSTPTNQPQCGDSSTNAEDILTRKDDPIYFSAEVIKIATKDFHEDLKLGEGGFGKVYKGTLPDGTDVAVKKLSLQSLQGKNEFTNEIKLLVNIQHKNLVNLLGCCVEGSQRILVYEYLSNGSLDKIIFDLNKKVCLNWPERFNIILGIAKGLLYLHEDSKLKIIHRDIKAANILLDDKFNPKISDFGLAKLSTEAETPFQTRVAGTYGYMAPEYAMHGQLSTKVDVYSFGVLVMEIIQARKNTDIDQCEGGIVEVAWKSFQEGHVLNVIDESIRFTCEYEEVSRCIHLGLLCVQSDPCLRPPMSTVVLMLSSNLIELPNPTLPAFLYLNNNLDATANGCRSHESSQGNQPSILSFPR